MNPPKTHPKMMPGIPSSLAFLTSGHGGMRRMLGSGVGARVPVVGAGTPGRTATMVWKVLSAAVKVRVRVWGPDWACTVMVGVVGGLEGAEEVVEVMKVV